MLKGLFSFSAFYLPLIVVGFFLAGCGAHIYHVVQPGETLYSISFHHGQDHREVAQWNDIDEPYVLRAGQRIRVAPPADEARPTPSRTAVGASPVRAPLKRPSDPSPGVREAAPPLAASTQEAVTWHWPVQEANSRPDATVRPARKGLDIMAAQGEAVRAAAGGRVVYSGGGIPHYGNLLIIKHNERFLSAYAHNHRLLVSEGEQVGAGQQVAEMGNSGTGTDVVKLHFEIRQDGLPVDPLRYLPDR